MERLFDIVEADRLADEPVQVEPSLQVEVDQHGEVPRREAVAVPARPQLAAPTEELDHGKVDPHVRGGHTHLHQGAGQVAGVEGLFHYLRVAHRLDADVCAVPVGEGLHGCDHVFARGVDHVGGPELTGHLELAGVEIDGDDRGGAGQHRTGDGRAAHAAAPEHGHRVTQAHLAGQH